MTHTSSGFFYGYLSFGVLVAAVMCGAAAPAWGWGLYVAAFIICAIDALVIFAVAPHRIAQRDIKRQALQDEKWELIEQCQHCADSESNGVIRTALLAAYHARIKEVKKELEEYE